MALKIMFRKQPQICCVLHNFRKKKETNENGTLHVVLAARTHAKLLFTILNFRSGGGLRPVAFAVSRNSLSDGCSTLLYCLLFVRTSCVSLLSNFASRACACAILNNKKQSERK